LKFSTSLFLIIFGLTTCICQKVVQKVMILPHARAIQIDASRFSEVFLNTAPGVELQVEATMEGEYQKDLGIEITEEGQTIFINGAFQPFFEAPNDKLSAHKVVAVILRVQVPEGRDVSLIGSSTQVRTSGVYRELDITLNDGQCILESPEGKVKVHTQSGNIHLRAHHGKLSSESKYGTVKREEIPGGRNQYDLVSLHGDIYVKRIS
jgi:hypothetical protein